MNKLSENTGKFLRSPSTDDSFRGMHGLKPKVSYRRISNEIYEVKLELGGKEVIIREEIEKGLTKLVTLTYNGKVYNQPSVYQAECTATKLFKGEKCLQ